MSISISRAASTRTLLANAFFLAVLFPFASPLPVSADTQPVALLLAVCLLGIEVFCGRSFSWRDVALLGLPIGTLLYLDPAVSPLLPEQLGKYISLFAGAAVYVVARRNFHRFRPGVFRAAIVFYFVYTLLLLERPDVFLRIQGYFVRGINAEADNPFGFRGVLTFSTEPGLFGGLLIFHLFMLEYYRRNRAYSRRTYLMLLAMISFMVIATKSGTGYLYFVLYLIYRLASRPKLALKVGAALAAGAALVTASGRLDVLSGLGRGVQVMRDLLSLRLLSVDTSTIGRLNDLSVGFVSLLHFPFGSGANGVNSATAWLNSHYEYLKAYNGTGAIGLVSGIAYCSVAYGFLGVAYLVYAYVIASRAPIGNRIFSLIYLSFSYSPAFPPLWVLLAEPSASAQPSSAPGAGATSPVVVHSERESRE